MQDGLCSRIKPLLLLARHILRTHGERTITVGFAGAQHNLLPRAGRLSAAAEKCLSYPPFGPTPNSCRPPARRQRRSCGRNLFDEEVEATKRLKLLQNSDCERVVRNPTNTLLPHARTHARTCEQLLATPQHPLKHECQRAARGIPSSPRRKALC